MQGKTMKKTVRISSPARMALGGLVLGLTLVGAVSQSAHAQQQASPALGTDVRPSPDISANASTGSDQGGAPPARLVIQSPYTPPSMGGSDIPSNHRGSHGDGNPNS
jgi:hypothetical protein